MINKIIKLACILALPALLEAKKLPLHRICDTCYLFSNVDSLKIMEQKKFHALYIDYGYTTFLGWFAFSDTQILYLSPVHEARDLWYPQANKIQILFDKEQWRDTNTVYYLDIFSHCKFLGASYEKEYLLKVQNVNPRPSHAAVLKELFLSKDLKTMRLIVDFMGDQRKICLFKVSK